MKHLMKHKGFIALSLLPMVLCALFYTSLPKQIPAHLNMRFEIDRWGDKIEIFIFPIIILVFGLGMLWYLFFEDKKAEQNPNGKVGKIILLCVLMLFNIMFIGMLYLAFHGEAMQTALMNLDIVKIIFPLIGASLIIIGNIMPKLKLNAMMGLRTSWSMKNERVWRKSQMMGGISFILSGILIIAGGFLFPMEIAFIFMMAVIIFDGIFSMVMSYVIYRKDEASHALNR